MSPAYFRLDIQGIRAIAVLVVMLFHFNPAWLPGGFVGVDIFLVVSGFLITRILLNKKSQADYTLSGVIGFFYLGRFKRIFPAYFTMLILVALVAALLFLPQDFDGFKKGLEKSAWFNSNNYFAGFGDYFSPVNFEQPLLHTWSLAVEIQFYLLAPFMVLLLPIKVLKWVFVGLLIGLTAVAEYRLRVMGLEQATYYSLYARLPEFFAGGLAALYVLTKSDQSKNNAWLSIIGLALIILSVIVQPVLSTFPGVTVLLPVVGCVMLLCQPSKGLVGKVLCSKGLVWIGALSYSLYLWHWPVLAFLRYATGGELLDLTYSSVFVVLTLVLSVISYRLCERPFRKKQALGWSLLLVSVLAVSWSMVSVNQLFTPEELPLEYRRYADPKNICHGQIVGDCLRGDLSSNKEILVLGDSHAAMLNHFFDSLGKELGFRARIITASGCVVIPGFDVERIKRWARKICLKQIERVEKELQDAKVVFVASLWTSHFKSNNFILAFEEFMDFTSNENQHVYLMSQEPLLYTNPLRALRLLNLGLRTNTDLDPAYMRANEILKGYASGNEIVSFLDLTKLPLFYDVPLYDGKLIYFDKHHINEYAAREYAAQAKEIIEIIFDSDQK